MKIGINLATQPFRRDRPVLVIGAVLGTALSILLVLLIYLSVNESGERADARRGVDQLQRRLKLISAEQQKLDAVLRRPENAEVLERSQFLNALLYRKGISWTRIFADLEKVVPHNVRIMQIRPTLNSKNEVVLDMQVGTESPEPLISLLKTLEDSPVFGPAYLHTSAPPSQSDPLWKYRISVNYGQRLDLPPGSGVKIHPVAESPAAPPAAPAAAPMPSAQPKAPQPVSAVPPRPVPPPTAVVPPGAAAPPAAAAAVPERKAPPAQPFSPFRPRVPNNPSVKNAQE